MVDIVQETATCKEVFLLFQRKRVQALTKH